MSRLRTFVFIVATGAIFVLAAIWILTLPAAVSAAALPPHTPNLANGETMFNIGGCSSCHAVPNDNPEKVDRMRLAGGLALKSPFGVFYAPNISSDARDGIGNWSEANFVTALWKGTSDHGTNLYPAFPYTSYRYMQLDGVRDLFAYLKTLPPVPGRSRRHELSFPFNERRLLGIWKLLFLGEESFVIVRNATARETSSAVLSKASASPADHRRTAATGCRTSRRSDSSVTMRSGPRKISRAFSTAA